MLTTNSAEWRGILRKKEALGKTIQTTALVHEAYLKLVDAGSVEWQRRAHFFAVSARIMRRTLLDLARRRLAGKRGGAAAHNNLNAVPDLGSPPWTRGKRKS